MAKPEIQRNKHTHAHTFSQLIDKDTKCGGDNRSTIFIKLVYICIYDQHAFDLL